MKRELLFIATTMVSKLDEPRLEVVAKLHHLGPSKEDDPLTKTVLGYLCGIPEGMLGRLIVEMTILLRVSSGQDSNRVLDEAAKEYNISVDFIATTRGLQTEAPRFLSLCPSTRLHAWLLPLAGASYVPARRAHGEACNECGCRNDSLIDETKYSSYGLRFSFAAGRNTVRLPRY
jgi:hypothetical protein